MKLVGPLEKGQGWALPRSSSASPWALTELPLTCSPVLWEPSHRQPWSLEVTQAPGTAFPTIPALPMSSEKDVFLERFLVIMLLVYCMKKAGHKISLTLWLVNMYIFIIYNIEKIQE